MLGKIYKELIIIVLVFAAAWYLLTQLNLQPEEPEVAVSIETEQELGELLIESFLSTETQIKNDTMMQAVNIIRDRLKEGVGLTNYDYKIYVIKSKQVNAFATLGGHIVVFTGLIDFADSPEEVAAVLAHEIGHVEERHVVNKLVKELGLTVLFSVLSGGDPILIQEILKQTTSTVFDRRQETAADKFAYKLLEKSDINPRYIASFFRKLEEKYGNEFDNLEFLMTHPNLNKRIKGALEYEVKDNFKAEELGIDWDAVKRNLN